MYVHKLTDSLVLLLCLGGEGYDREWRAAEQEDTAAHCRKVLLNFEVVLCVACYAWPPVSRMCMQGTEAVAPMQGGVPSLDG